MLRQAIEKHLAKQAAKAAGGAAAIDNAAMNRELAGKGATIQKYEFEIRRRNDEIDKKTKEVVDRLNRPHDRLTSNVKDENLGPLAATIANITREIGSKVHESKELQRQ